MRYSTLASPTAKKPALPMIVSAPLTANARDVSSSRSMIGNAWVRQRRASRTAANALTITAIAVFRPSQPQSSPCTIARLSSAIAIASSSAPTMSGSERLPGARLSTRWLFAIRQTTRPSGRLMRNTSRQSAMLTSNPPIDGPSPAARAPVALHNATA